jgi:very-short-patch-repair endonuclease
MSKGQKRVKSKLKQNALFLRKNQTPEEERLWYFLRAKRFLGFKFKRQFVIEPYIVDFCCLKKRLVVEVDGGQHNLSAKDKLRDKFLHDNSFKVLRFWNNEVKNSIESVLEKIYSELES